MRRRDFITFLAGGMRPLARRAQQKAMPVIGFLGLATAAVQAPWLAAWRSGLAETGYAEGKNAVIEYGWAEDRAARLPALAADLVARRVDVIATTGGIIGALAAKNATSTIPIVYPAATRSRSAWSSAWPGPVAT
jgi:ABC-type uncharacterized transport system substrate-binding protein